MLPLYPLIFGLSILSGLNLYLTTFLVGVAVRLGWWDAGLHPALALLAHPAVMVVAGLLLLVEFFMDKIPWVDTLWDAVHTIIRPLGAAWLSYAILEKAGLSDGASTVVAIAGGVLALSAHLTKSGLRLLINASPEPVTNILASLAEDIIVILLVMLLLQAPVTGLATCLAFVIGTWIALPRLWALIRTSLVLMWKKCFGSRIYGVHAGFLPSALTVAQEMQLRELTVPVLGSETAIPFLPPGPGRPVPAWAAACVSGKSLGLSGHRAHRSGTLLSLASEPGSLVFLSRGWFRRRAVRVSLAGARIRQESTFLSENLVIFQPDDGLHLVFRFARGERPMVARLVADLDFRLGLTMPPPPLPAHREDAVPAAPPLPPMPAAGQAEAATSWSIVSS